MRERFSSTGEEKDCPFVDTPPTDGQSASVSSETAILLVDDNPTVARAIDIALRIAGYQVYVACNPEEAWSRLAQRRYAAILLDMNFTAGAADGEEGLACLRRIMADDPAACVVVITAHSGIRIAVAAMQDGARDFVMKPWRNSELVSKIGAAMKRTPIGQLMMPPGSLIEAPAVLIGESAAIRQVRALIKRVGSTRASVGVVITGPPGSGRALVARLIHASSPNAAGQATRIDLRSADGWDSLASAVGTIILRHVDQLDHVAQERLLDLLSPGVRVISIVSDLGSLTPALRRRLATAEIRIPPLAQRGDDVILLARHFARVAADRFGKGAVRLTPAAEAALRSAEWPDEVSGLALAIERAVILADDDIDAAALGQSGPISKLRPDDVASFDLSGAERGVILAALQKHRYNVTHAAVALGLSRGTLYRRMTRYGL